MWKLVEISQQSYFIYCNFNSIKQEFTFILYDLKDSWSQTLQLSDVKPKVKLLNKRFDFNENNIKEAFTSDGLQSAVIEEQPQTSATNLDNCLLKVKYRVKNCPLTYEWNLTKQDLIEFQHTFLKPLLIALFGCHQQVEILKESVRRKDEELKQYRLEGAVLNRSTLATKPFNFNDFNKQYEQCNKVAINFRELAKYVKENNPNQIPESEPKKVNKSEQDVKADEQQNEPRESNTKMSPKERKRKAKELKMQKMEEHLKLRKRGFQYESSQSQTPSSDNSQPLDDTEDNEKKQQKQVTETKSEKSTTPRKSNRCSPVKQRREYISSEDKTDSENDEKLISFRERNKINGLANAAKDNSTSSDKNGNTKKTENKNEKTIRKCEKSLNLSYNGQAKTLAKSLAILTDSEDEKPLVEKKKLKTTKNLSLSIRECTVRLRNTPSLVRKFPVEKVVKESLASPTLNRKNLSLSSTTVIIDDLSSQLSNIKKDLECLEAMRLADLKQRTCKA